MKILRGCCRIIGGGASLHGFAPMVMKRFEIIEKLYLSKALLKMAGGGMHPPTPPPGSAPDYHGWTTQRSSAGGIFRREWLLHKQMFRLRCHNLLTKDIAVGAGGFGFNFWAGSGR